MVDVQVNVIVKVIVSYLSEKVNIKLNCLKRQVRFLNMMLNLRTTKLFGVCNHMIQWKIQSDKTEIEQ